MHPVLISAVETRRDAGREREKEREKMEGKRGRKNGERVRVMQSCLPFFFVRPLFFSSLLPLSLSQTSRHAVYLDAYRVCLFDAMSVVCSWVRCLRRAVAVSSPPTSSSSSPFFVCENFNMLVEYQCDSKHTGRKSGRGGGDRSLRREREKIGLGTRHTLTVCQCQ